LRTAEQNRMSTARDRNSGDVYTWTSIEFSRRAASTALVAAHLSSGEAIPWSETATLIRNRS
jgi:hypothetical protein